MAINIDGSPLVGVYAGTDANNLHRFDSWLGRPSDAVLTYVGDANWADMNPTWAMSVMPAGRTQLFSIPLFPQTSSLAEVASGSQNGRFEEIARTILANADKVDAPDGSIYVRTAWEMGGEWFPWGQQGNDHPDLFIAAFRNFAEAFHAVSDRFKIVWDVSGDRGDVSKFYPGDDAVDVMSQDFYWEPQWTSYDGAKAFEIVRDRPFGLQWLENFAAQHGKATAYSEWGVRPGEGGAAFVQKALEWFNDPNHRVVYQTYWDMDANYPGKLSDGSDAATGAAYRDGLGLA